MGARGRAGAGVGGLRVGRDTREEPVHLLGHLIGLDFPASLKVPTSLIKQTFASLRSPFTLHRAPNCEPDGLRIEYRNLYVRPPFKRADHEDHT